MPDSQKIVALPSGERIAFPAGMPDNQINVAIQQYLGSKEPKEGTAAKLGRGAAMGAFSGLGIPESETPVADLAKALNTSVNRAATTPWAKGGPVYGTLALVGNMLKGIPVGMYSSGKEAITGGLQRDPELTAHGVSSLLTQLLALRGAVGKGGTPEAGVIEKTRATSLGVVKIAGREIPTLRGQVTGPEGNWAERASRTMETSVVGGPVKKVLNQQQSLARQMISDFSTASAGTTALEPNEFVSNISKSAGALKSQADGLYGSIRNDLSDTRGARVQFDQLQREFSDLGQQTRAAFRRGQGQGTLTEWHDLMKARDAAEQNIADFVVAQKKPELWERWQAAREASRTQHAMENFHDTVDSVIKGLSPEQMRVPGTTVRPQTIPSGQLLEKLKDMNSRLDQAIGKDNSSYLKQTMQVLSNAESRGAMGGRYAHYIVSAGPMIGAAEELIRRGSLAGAGEALALYPALWAFSKMLSFPSGRVALLNFLQSITGTPGEAVARQRALGVLSILARHNQGGTSNGTNPIRR